MEAFAPTLMPADCSVLRTPTILLRNPWFGLERKETVTQIEKNVSITRFVSARTWHKLDMRKKRAQK